MTDTAAARAYPPEPEEEAGGKAEVFPPAAHTHGLGGSRQPSISSSRTAVMESVPPLGFPGEGARASFGGQPTAPEPPPFGFNAPVRQEADAETSPPPPRPGSSPGSSRPAAPPWAVPGPDARPAWQSRRDTMPPRELMPSAAPVQRHRLGDTPTPTFGPPGKERSAAVMVLLSIITLGFYAVAWHRRVNQEMGDFDPRVHVHPTRSAWAVALPLLAGLLGTAAAGAVIAIDHFGVALDVPVTVRQAELGLAAIVAVPCLVLVVPFSLLAVAMTAERVRVVEDHAGLTTDEQIRPAALVGWLLFPVIGGFVVMARQQSRLNRIWRLARA